MKGARRRHEIYERAQNRERGEKNPAKFSPPIFVQFRIVEWSNDINESKGKGKGKVFPLWRPPAPFGIGAERRQSKIRAENKGNKKSQKKSTDNISESLRSLARPSKKREGGDLSRTFFSSAKLSLRKGTLCFPDDDKSHLPFLKKALFLFLARRARPDVMTAP